MESSKLPSRHWFAAMHFLTVNKKSFSAKSIQEELGHKQQSTTDEINFIITGITRAVPS
jgi:hypothetical protein